MRYLLLACLAFSLGLANHLSIALLLPGALAWLWPHRAVLAEAPRRAWLAAATALAAGPGLYLYLPWAAAGHPPVNWGDPRSLQGLAWLVGAEPYRSLVFGLAPAELPRRLAAWAGQALAQFWPWGAALALFGLRRLDRTDHAWWRFTGFNALCFSVYALAYNSADSYVYLIPAWAMAALWLAHGIAGLKSEIRDWRLAATLQSLISILMFVLLPVASAAGRWPVMDLSRDTAADEFVAGALTAAQPGGVIVVAGDQRTFALWYAIYGLGRRADLAPVNANLYAYPWYRETLIGHHPVLAAAAGSDDLPALPELLQRVAATGPLYRAEALPADAGVFEERAVGPLVQLSSEVGEP